MKFYHFFLLMLLVALLVFGLIFGLNPDGFRTVIENRESLAEGSEWVDQIRSLQGLTRYIHENPGRVSLFSVTAEHPDSVLSLNPDTPRTMGMTAGVLLLIAYEDAFEKGILNREAEFPWSDVARFKIPGLGEPNHREAYRYGVRQGLIDSDGVLELDHALSMLIRSNDLALFDFLLVQLPEDHMNDVMEAAGLQTTGLPLPFTGLYLTLAPSVQEEPFEVLLERWVSAGEQAFRDETSANRVRFIEGDERGSWLRALERDRFGVTFMQERDMLQLFPKTTAREMTGLLLRLRNRTLISEEVSLRVKERMRRHMEERGMTENFSDYGAWYDNRIGLLNGIDFGTSIYTSDTMVQAVYFDPLHIAVWFHMSSSHMHQDFQQRLIWDPALIDIMRK